MGRDKALLQRDGKSQLQRAIELLRDVTEKHFVSTRADQQDDAERQRYPQIVDRYDDIGPIAGILSALETHPEVDWLVLACDLPNLDRQTLDHLIEHASVEKPFTAFRSSHDGLPEPLCAIFRSDSAAIIRTFVEEGLVCPRKILIRSDTMLLQQPNPAALDNVNTPDDLASSILHAAR
jgi:molybdopterin-guanine dinucleotide biosynthesis protein A